MTSRFFALCLLVVAACARPMPKASRPALIVHDAPVAAPPLPPPSPPCAEDELARRVADVASAMAPGRRVEVHGASASVACTLETRRLAIVAREADVTIELVADAERSAEVLRNARAPLVVAWTDDVADAAFGAEFHFVVPIDGRSGHIVALPATADRHPRSALRIRFAERGLWARTIGREVLAPHDDGTADVRVVGYLAGESLMVADRWEPAIALHVSDPARPDVAALEKKLMTSNEPFGPPRAHVRSDLVRTPYFAVGSCSSEWVSALPIVVRGRLRARDGGLTLDAERIERTLPSSMWTALRPRYTTALRDVTAATKRHDLPAARHTIHGLREAIQRAYGDASSLLEVDVLLARLERAYDAGSFAAVRSALEDTRCALSAEETDLLGVLPD